MHQKWIIMFLACVWNRKIARFGAEMSEKVNNRVWRATFGTSSKPAKRNGNRSSSTYALELRFCNRSHNHFSNFNCSCETCPKFGSVCRVAAAHPEFMVLPAPLRKKKCCAAPNWSRKNMAHKDMNRKQLWFPQTLWSIMPLRWHLLPASIPGCVVTIPDYLLHRTTMGQLQNGVI